MIHFRRRIQRKTLIPGQGEKECVVGRTRVSERFYGEEEEAAVSNERVEGKEEARDNSKGRYMSISGFVFVSSMKVLHL